MAKGYSVAQVDVTDAYARYAGAAGSFLMAYGAQAIDNPDTALVNEGSPKAPTVILEFDSFDSTNAFCNSTKNKTTLRVGAAGGVFMLMEGVDF